MSFLYFSLSLILYIISLPFILFLSTKKKYKEAIPARFFLKKNSKFKNNGVWFHACSFGEVRSLKPIIDELKSTINISVITNTGYEEAKKYKADIRYLPYELLLPFWISKNRVLVVSEAELWYMLFFMAKRRGIKTILINARISDNSYKNYKRFSFLYKKIFQNIDAVFAQSQKDSHRLEELGAKNIQVNGNIKSFQTISITKEFSKPIKKVLTLASTHQNEESLILENIDSLNEFITIVVPRHPERFDDVDLYLQEFAKKNSFSYHRYSQQEDFESDIVLIDKMGELINIYAISEIVVLGGSFVKNVGGHNPLEPAHFHCKIISGKYVFNQEALYSLVDNINMIEIDKLNKTILDASLKNTKITQHGEILPILTEIRAAL